jgi:hypothetical protein
MKSFETVSQARHVTVGWVPPCILGRSSQILYLKSTVVGYIIRPLLPLAVLPLVPPIQWRAQDFDNGYSSLKSLQIVQCVTQRFTYRPSYLEISHLRHLKM